MACLVKLSGLTPYRAYQVLHCMFNKYLRCLLYTGVCGIICPTGRLRISQLTFWVCLTLAERINQLSFRLNCRCLIIGSLSFIIVLSILTEFQFWLSFLLAFHFRFAQNRFQFCPESVMPVLSSRCGLYRVILCNFVSHRPRFSGLEKMA